MNLDVVEYKVYMSGVFKKYGSDYANIVAFIKEKDAKQGEKLEILSRFYFYICSPNDVCSSRVREEVQIVGLTSMIECMMKEEEYQDVFKFFDEEYCGKNEIINFSEFKSKYLQRFGLTKKVRKYFDKYLNVADASEILKYIRIFSKKKNRFVPLKNLSELANLLYQMRSDFVHNADMRNFCPVGCSGALLIAGEKLFSTELSIASIINLFEKSFVNYWQDKFNYLKERYGT